jgi:hypothetical protein
VRCVCLGGFVRCFGVWVANWGEGVQRRECALRHVGGHVASAAPSAACAALLRLQNNHMRRAIRHNTAKRARGEVGW